MRTKRIKLYSFEELTSEAQQTAIEKNFDINLDGGFDWWENVYEDAKNQGVEIKGFDIDRGSYCNIDLMWNHLEVANEIVKEHGDMCDTYKLSKQFIEEYAVKYDMLENSEQQTNYDLEAEIEELEDAYILELSECYLKLLRDEYEYLSSEEAIKETLIANEYEFTADGKIFND